MKWALALKAMGHLNNAPLADSGTSSPKQSEPLPIHADSPWMFFIAWMRKGSQLLRGVLAARVPLLENASMLPDQELFRTQIKAAQLRRQRAVAEIQEIWRQDRNEEMDMMDADAPNIEAFTCLMESYRRVFFVLRKRNAA
jgi:hypothetical protein